MMHWDRLLTNKRLGQEHRHSTRHDARTEFKRDYDRLIFSAPFRRLQNKTQVFPLPGSVFVHNRLTHSLEVASVGMSLGTDVGRTLAERDHTLEAAGIREIGQIVAAAGLAHDMGNPPFGHSGEKAMQTFFTEGPGQEVKTMVSETFWSDITHFEGNANAFRLLTHRFCGRRQGGFVMTYPTLAAIVKYPYSSLLAGKKGKFGFFESEREVFERIAGDMGMERLSPPGQPARYARHPLVLLVEAADDICYEIMDIEDALKLRILSYEETSRLLLGFFDEGEQKEIHRRIANEGLTDDNERVVYMRSCAIGRLEAECVRVFIESQDEILAGTFEGSLISHTSDDMKRAYNDCMDISQSRIYRSKPVLDVELSGYHIMHTLMEKMVDAALHPDRYYSKQLMERVSNQYDVWSPSLETRIMAVIDYISGMTDVYALDAYQKINGISLPIV